MTLKIPLLSCAIAVACLLLSFVMAAFMAGAAIATLAAIMSLLAFAWESFT